MFNKRSFLFIILLSFFLLSKFAHAAIGISPAIIELDFKPNLKQVFHFELLSDQDNSFKIHATGDLSQYVKLSTNYLNGPGGVNVLLELPDEIDIPGVHNLYIGGRQLVDKQEGFSIVGDINAVIRIKVPYPERYATTTLNAGSVKAGEPVNFEGKIENLGEKFIFTSPYIEVYNSLNKTISVISIQTLFIEPANSGKFSASLNTTKEQAGFYTAKAVVNYGGKNPATSEAQFRLGKLYIDVANHSNNFLRNQINRFNIDIESFWNDPVENVFAEVKILDSDISFLTPSVSLQGFEKKTLNGFFDTNSIKEDVQDFKAKIIVHYEGKTTEKIVDLHFKREVNYLLYGLIAGIIAFIILLILITLWYRKLKKRKDEKGIQ